MLAGAASGKPICALLYAISLQGVVTACATAHGAILQIRRKAKSRSGLRKPGYAAVKLGGRGGLARMRSTQVPSAIAVRVGLTCASTSGEGVLAIAPMTRFCNFRRAKARASKAQAQGDANYKSVKRDLIG